MTTKRGIVILTALLVVAAVGIIVASSGLIFNKKYASTGTTKSPLIPITKISDKERNITVQIAYKALKNILGEKFNVLGHVTLKAVVPILDPSGKHIAAINVLFQFDKPVWLEYKFDNKSCMEWATAVNVLIDWKTKKIRDFHISSPGPHQLKPGTVPLNASPAAKRVQSIAFKLAKEYIAKKYNITLNKTRLIFYGVCNGIAYVVAVPKNATYPGWLVELKIDTNERRVIESAYYPSIAYISRER